MSGATWALKLTGPAGARGPFSLAGPRAGRAGGATAASAKPALPTARATPARRSRPTASSTPGYRYTLLSVTPTVGPRCLVGWFWHYRSESDYLQAAGYFVFGNQLALARAGADSPGLLPPLG